MKVKTADEVRELIDNMYLNEYGANIEEKASPKKKGMIDINTQDALLASNKLLSIQLETLTKRLEAREVCNTLKPPHALFNNKLEISTRFKVLRR